MKVFKHPLAVIISFIMILISGKQTGGFYILYLLLGLPHGGIHSITGILGTLLLLFGNLKSKQWGSNYISLCLNLLGVLLLWLSLFFFFYNDEGNYNITTFYQLLPQILLSLFLLISIVFFVHNILLLLKHPKNNYNSSTQK